MTPRIGMALAALLVAVAAAASDVQLTKTAHAEHASTVVSPPLPGNRIVFVLEVANIGATPASGIVVTDTLAAGLTMERVNRLGDPWTCTAPAEGATGTVECSLASLAPGERRAFVISTRLSEAYPAPATLVNTATVATNTVDPNPANNTATAMLHIQGPAVPSLSVIGMIVLASLLAIAAVLKQRA